MLFKPVIDTPHKPLCGPTAAAILTGVPVSKIEAMIRRGRRGGYRDSNGRKIPIRGTYHHEIIRVLKALGCKAIRFKLAEGTVAKFTEDVKHAGAFFVRTSGHFLTCSGGIIADNWKPEGVTIGNYPRDLSRVTHAWRVIAPALPRFTLDDALAATKPPKPKPDRQAERIARILLRLKTWEAKRKRAETAIKKLRKQVKYYERKAKRHG